MKAVAAVLLILAVSCSSSSEKSPAPEAEATTVPGIDVPAATGGGPAATAGTPARRGGPTTRTERATRPSAGSPGARPGRLDEIRLGYAVIDSTGFAALTGTNEQTLQDQNSEQNSAAGHQEMQALVRWANRSGGVGGRKIKAFGFDIPVTSQPDARVEYCIDAAEDKKVSVFIDQSIFLSEATWSCFARHKVSYVGIVQATDRQYINTVRPYITTTRESLDRDMVMMVEGLNSVKYFKGAKVGVVLTDLPTVERDYQKFMLPAFRKIGVKVADVARLAPPISAQVGPQASSAVLQFKAQGITHVVMVAGLLEYLAFANQAESQSYHPRYGFGDYQSTTGVAAYYGLASQNRNAIGVSTDLVSVQDRDEPNDTQADIKRNEVNQATRRCLDIYTKELKKNYWKPSQSAPSAGALYYCDHFFLWLEGARKVGAPLTSRLFGSGLAKLGTSYLSPFVDKTAWSPGRHDGAASYRVGRYSERNKVFVRMGAVRQLKF